MRTAEPLNERSVWPGCLLLLPPLLPHLSVPPAHLLLAVYKQEVSDADLQTLHSRAAARQPTSNQHVVSSSQVNTLKIAC